MLIGSKNAQNSLYGSRMYNKFSYAVERPAVHVPLDSYSRIDVPIRMEYLRWQALNCATLFGTSALSTCLHAWRMVRMLY